MEEKERGFGVRRERGATVNNRGSLADRSVKIGPAINRLRWEYFVRANLSRTLRRSTWGLQRGAPRGDEWRGEWGARRTRGEDIEGHTKGKGGE